LPIPVLGWLNGVTSTTMRMAPCQRRFVRSQSLSPSVSCSTYVLWPVA